MKTKKIIIPIIIYSFFITSCSHKIQLFKNIAINNESKLYFYNVPEDNPEKLNQNKFIQKHKNFYIDNQVVLKKIKDEWILEKSTNHVPLESFYRINWLEGNKVLRSGLLHFKGNEIITAPYPLKFEIEMLEKYSDNFKHLDSYTVKCNIINARLLYEELNNKGYFIEIFKNENKENPLYLYDGKTSLLLSYQKGADFKAIENLVQKDFKKIDNTKIARFSASIKKDSIEIDVYSKTDISNLIPKKYTIVKNFTLLKNINFSVFGIDRDKLDRIITNLKLEDKVKVKNVF